MVDAVGVDPLPYIVVFVLLFVGLLIALTWTLDQWYKEHQCVLQPNIWCSDDWTCNSSCPTGSDFNACFNSVGPTGLASCLFGPASAVATLCYPQASTPTGSTVCACTPGMSSTNNCFSGCASTLDNIAGGAICCCKSGPNCTPNAAQCQAT